MRGLEKRVATGRLKDRAKIERMLGRLQASYASVADLYEMEVREAEGQFRLHWTLIEDRRAWRDAREGAYLLRTNLVGQTVEELWIASSRPFTDFIGPPSSRPGLSWMCLPA